LLNGCGKISSAFFKFPEREKDFKKADRTTAIKSQWIAANSSHVIDLFTFFCGGIDVSSLTMSPFRSTNDLNPVYCGFGSTLVGNNFGYFADWNGVGGWAVEVVTQDFTLLLDPLEKLQVKFKADPKMNFFIDEKTPDSLEPTKPGFYLMVQRFLSGDHEHFTTMEEQINTLTFCDKVGRRE
jgi:hypothetical protein